MDIKAGSTYKCDFKNLTARIHAWDPVYGVWRGTVTGYTGVVSDIYWLKNGCRFLEMRSDYDLKSEIREPRTFYATEYCSLDGENRLGVTVYEKDRNDLNTKFMGTEFKQIIKLVEVLE